MKDRTTPKLSRRDEARLTLAVGVGALCASRSFAADPAALITKAIPSSGQRLPVIGIGTNAFSEARHDDLRPVLKRMAELGGSVIDTAPAYGESEQVIGELVAELGIRDRIFLATKLTAPDPLQRSFERLKTDHLDLLQVHNLQGVEQLWPQLIEWQR